MMKAYLVVPIPILLAQAGSGSVGRVNLSGVFPQAAGPWEKNLARDDCRSAKEMNSHTQNEAIGFVRDGNVRTLGDFVGHGEKDRELTKCLGTVSSRDVLFPRILQKSTQTVNSIACLLFHENSSLGLTRYAPVTHVPCSLS